MILGGFLYGILQDSEKKPKNSCNYEKSVLE